MSDHELISDLAALVAPGGNRGTTIDNTTRPGGGSPRGWEPGVKFAADDLGMVVTTPPRTENVTRDENAWGPMVADMGLEVPPGYRVRMVEAKYDPAAWHRDELFVQYPDADDREAGKKWTKAPAVTRPVWRYRFAIEPEDGRRLIYEDVDKIAAEVLKKRPRRKRPAPPGAVRRALNVVYADPQAGKVALLGGTKELAARVGEVFDLLEDHRRDIAKVGRPATEATWWDGGDCIEGFNNVRSQERTNDLQLTQQVRAHRRFSMYGLGKLAEWYDAVQAVTAGSNHARNRDGKDPVAGPDDDWGIEVMSQIQDAYALNPAAYGHVKFGYPHPQRDSLAIDSGGLLMGLAHGHQFKSPDTKAVRSWWSDQGFGNQPVKDARVLISGHFHHFAAREMGDGRLWVQAPTLDNGSDWFTMIAGELSKPGLLVFSSTEDGWDDLRILRAAA